MFIEKKEFSKKKNLDLINEFHKINTSILPDDLKYQILDKNHKKNNLA